MKHPPTQYADYEAFDMLEAFIAEMAAAPVRRAPKAQYVPAAVRTTAR